MQRANEIDQSFGREPKYDLSRTTSKPTSTSKSSSIPGSAGSSSKSSSGSSGSGSRWADGLTNKTSTSGTARAGASRQPTQDKPTIDEEVDDLKRAWSRGQDVAKDADFLRRRAVARIMEYHGPTRAEGERSRRALLRLVPKQITRPADLDSVREAERRLAMLTTRKAGAAP